MKDPIKRTYYRLLVPAVSGFILTGLMKRFLTFSVPGSPLSSASAAMIFVLSAVLAVAAPILIRTLFAAKNRSRKQISRSEFVRFEQRLIRVVLMAPYLSLTAFWLNIDHLYSAGSILMSLYAAYYFYPSPKRIDLDRKIFRVTP